MTKTDQRKTKAELIAELGAVRAHLAGLCDACNVGESDKRYRRLGRGTTITARFPALRLVA